MLNFQVLVYVFGTGMFVSVPSVSQPDPVPELCPSRLNCEFVELKNHSKAIQPEDPYLKWISNSPPSLPPALTSRS